MKLLEKLRWLPTESPAPGTADVSANSCVLPMLVGDTPGTSSARSRKLRPFSGRLCDFGLRDRAGDLAARRLEHRRLAGDGDARRRRRRRASDDRQIERRADGQRQRARRVRESLQVDRDLVRSDLQVRETGSGRPDRSTVSRGDVRLGLPRRRPARRARRRLADR